jgi:hypothetical protein
LGFARSQGVLRPNMASPIGQVAIDAESACWCGDGNGCANEQDEDEKKSTSHCFTAFSFLQTTLATGASIETRSVGKSTALPAPLMRV